MAAIIQSLIDLRNFEKVRNRIGLILTEEVKNQSILDANNPDIDAKVYIERTVSVDHTETPLINVMFSAGSPESQTAKQVDNSYTYFIDIYTSAQTKGVERADKLSQYKLHRLIGICQGILENPLYKTLGFAMPSIERAYISNTAIAQPQNKGDATNSVFGRITFVVRVPETVPLLDVNPIAGADTSIKLHETDLGYMYKFDS